LQTTLTAGGDAATYRWDLGDGATAVGPVVQHAYAAGRFTARVTAKNAAGETATAAVTVTSVGLTLAAPRVGRYQQLLRFYGRLVPAAKSAPIGLFRGARRVATVRTDRRGRFVVRGRVGTPDARYSAHYAGAVSNQLALAVRPGLDTAFQGSGSIGGRLVLVARERPANAGPLIVRVRRSGLVRTYVGRSRLRIRLDTGSPSAYQILVSIAPAPGYLPTRRSLQQTIHAPALAIGDRGLSVYALERRLNELHFALGRVDSYYGSDTSDAVVAFQKLYGLPRTGAVDERVWYELETAQVPRARYPEGTHVEVSKGRQVLFMVRNGKVQLIVPVSTGATGNTPFGLWHVYSKVPGYNAKQMYYSSFFVGGFAIHGYATVPTYPASHGCVRMPLWVAVRIYSLIDYGTPVYIYW
jgi:peptidoglycan hydrolase-like protein with peptidoglycan-binding domain